MMLLTCWTCATTRRAARCTTRATFAAHYLYRCEDLGNRGTLALRTLYLTPARNGCEYLK